MCSFVRAFVRSFGRSVVRSCARSYRFNLQIIESQVRFGDSGEGPTFICACESKKCARACVRAYNWLAVCFLLMLRAPFPIGRAAEKQVLGGEVQFAQPRAEQCNGCSPSQHIRRSTSLIVVGTNPSACDSRKDVRAFVRGFGCWCVRFVVGLTILRRSPTNLRQSCENQMHVRVLRCKCGGPLEPSA